MPFPFCVIAAGGPTGADELRTLVCIIIQRNKDVCAVILHCTYALVALTRIPAGTQRCFTLNQC